MVKIAVIGTGFAAATLASRLNKAGFGSDLTFFDKSRGIGGRMATRYTDTHQFDHGAQFFNARSPSFQAFLEEFIEAGDVAEWKPNVTTLSTGDKPYKRLWYEPHYVAAPRMNGLCKKILSSHENHADTEIRKIERRGDSNWLVTTDQARFGPFDWVVSTAPAPQSSRLFASASDPGFDDVTFDPCIALMVALETAPSFDAAVVKDSVIEWIAFTDTKPARDSAPSLVAHATPAFSQRHLEKEPASLIPELVERVSSLTGINASTMTEASAHRWRFARARTPLNRPFWIDADQKLAACGDWCLGNTVEHAYTSASELARAMIQRLNVV